jgi:hypothetical protein
MTKPSHAPSESMYTARAEHMPSALALSRMLSMAGSIPLAEPSEVEVLEPEDSVLHAPSEVW